MTRIVYPLMWVFDQPGGGVDVCWIQGPAGSGMDMSPPLCLTSYTPLGHPPADITLTGIPPAADQGLRPVSVLSQHWPLSSGWCGMGGETRWAGKFRIWPHALALGHISKQMIRPSASFDSPTRAHLRHSAGGLGVGNEPPSFLAPKNILCFPPALFTRFGLFPGALHGCGFDVICAGQPLWLRLPFLPTTPVQQPSTSSSGTKSSGRRDECTIHVSFFFVCFLPHVLLNIKTTYLETPSFYALAFSLFFSYFVIAAANFGRSSGIRLKQKTAPVCLQFVVNLLSGDILRHGAKIPPKKNDLVAKFLNPHCTNIQ